MIDSLALGTFCQSRPWHVCTVGCVHALSRLCGPAAKEPWSCPSRYHDGTWTSCRPPLSDTRAASEHQPGSAERSSLPGCKCQDRSESDVNRWHPETERFKLPPPVLCALCSKKDTTSPINSPPHQMQLSLWRDNDIMA